MNTEKVTPKQSEIDKRILEASKEFIPYDYGHSGDEQRDAFIDGAKFILEMPEVREAFKALEFYSLSCREKYGQLYNKTPSAQDKEVLVYAQVAIGTEARQALSKLRELGLV